MAHDAFAQRATQLARFTLQEHGFTGADSLGDVPADVRRRVAADMVSEFGAIEMLTIALDGDEPRLNCALRRCLLDGADRLIAADMQLRMSAAAAPWIERALEELPGGPPHPDIEAAARDHQARCADLNAERTGDAQCL